MSYQNKYTIRSKAIIYQGELDYISRCVLDYPGIETGGDIFGFWTHSGYPVIQYIIGPGQKSNHQIAFFNQDLEYLELVGTALRRAHGLQHIGEWHSHHRLGLAEPSGHDISTVCNAINLYGLNNFFLVITNVRDQFSSINGFMFKKEQGRIFDYTGWIILEGESPIRKSFDKDHFKLVYEPKTEKAAITGLTKVSLTPTAYAKPEYTAEYWLSEKSNQIVLKVILDGLREISTDVNIFQQNENKSVYLNFRHVNKSYSLLFPNDFPQLRPIVANIADGQSINIETVNIPWSPNGNIAHSTVMFVQEVIRTFNPIS